MYRTGFCYQYITIAFFVIILEGTYRVRVSNFRFVIGFVDDYGTSPNKQILGTRHLKLWSKKVD